MPLRFDQYGDRENSRFKPPPNYSSRPMQYRLLGLVMLLMLVFAVMDRARDPEIYRRFFRAFNVPLVEDREGESGKEKGEAGDGRVKSAGPDDDRAGDASHETEMQRDDGVTGEFFQFDSGATGGAVASQNPLEQARREGWRSAVAGLRREDNEAFRAALDAAFFGHAMDDDVLARWDSIRPKMDQAWSVYLEVARDSLDEPAMQLNENEQLAWRNVLEQLAAHWKDEATPALDAISEQIRREKAAGEDSHETAGDAGQTDESEAAPGTADSAESETENKLDAAASDETKESELKNRELENSSPENAAPESSDSAFDEAAVDRDEMSPHLPVLFSIRRDLLQLAVEKIRDNMALRPAESDAWFGLFNELAHRDAAAAHAQSQGLVSYTELFKQPEVYRGQLVTVSGQVRQAYHVRLFSNPYGLTGYYVFTMKPADGSTSPLIVYALELPEGFPAVKDRDVDKGTTELNETVTFTGYLFKRWMYRSRRGGDLAPLVLARSPEWKPAASFVPAERPLPSVVQFAAVLVGVLCVAIAIAIWAYRQSERAAGIRRPRERGGDGRRDDRSGGGATPEPVSIEWKADAASSNQSQPSDKSQHGESP